jgi:hypothetical protein
MGLNLGHYGRLFGILDRKRIVDNGQGARLKQDIDDCAADGDNPSIAFRAGVHAQLASRVHHKRRRIGKFKSGNNTSSARRLPNPRHQTNESARAVQMLETEIRVLSAILIILNICLSR